MSNEVTSQSITMDYMTLLVTQLQNQNPLEPMDNSEMSAQLTQLSSLQQLENMNNNFEAVLGNAELQYANSLLGKEAFFTGIDATGAEGLFGGTVEQVLKQDDGSIIVSIDGTAVSLDDIISVREPVTGTTDTTDTTN